MVSQDNRLMTSPLDRGLDRPLTDLVQSKPYGASAAQPTNIRDYLFVILKRKWLILSLMLVVTSLVTIQMFRTPSIYEGKTTIRIEPKPKSVLTTKEVVINSATDPLFVGTQLKLLQNPALARQVVLTLDLQNNPSFLGGQSQGGFFSSLRNVFTRDRKPIAASPAVKSEIPIVGENALLEQPLAPEELARLEPYEDAITLSETVEPIEKTSLIEIKFQHTDPLLAQKVPNTIADVFITNNLDRAAIGSKKAEDVVAREIANLQLKVKQIQERQFNYAKSHNVPITNAPADNIEAKRLNELSTQVLEAQNLRKNNQAVWESAKTSNDPFSVPDVQKSEYIAKLRETISALKERRDALEVAYTKEWPEVQKIEAQLKPREQELERATAEILNGVKARYQSSVATEQALNRSYMEQRGTTTQQTHDQIEMLAIAQELETNKQFLNGLYQKQKELQAGSPVEKISDISVATYSRLPKQPVGPQRVRNIIIALILSLVAGIGLAFLLDFLDDTVNSMEDVDRYIHLPALALIPASKGDKARLIGMPTGPAPAGASNALALVDDARSPVAEAYRHLRTSLLLSSAGQPPKTILVTSSQPSEGKTTTAINTAFMLAQTGAEVLIIDCDLRRPRLHAHFEVSNSVGLTNWLSGDKNVDALIQSYDKLANLKLLTSGPVPPNPAELLGSDEMRKLLALLSERFAHIIIDSPPAISFTDASILSTMVDGVVLIVHGGKSSRAVVRRARQQLLDVGANIFGVVLNNVKLESQQDYYYAGYYGYYSSYYYSGDGDEKSEDGAAAPR
ncbi:MAG: polysaccharide biosynthesis tyrosine autokinase [Acidobacteriota bacterium]|nr:polysaccharide biosynthesis tyrosine autokinase [Acidobacteriota bacterium]